MSWQVVEGDCVEQMRAMGESSVDAIVTDPLSPYGLEFMGKEWDRLSAEVGGGGSGLSPGESTADLSGSFSEAKGRGEWAAQHGTSRKGFDGYGPLPNHEGGGNVKCPDCGRPVDGRDPDQPNPRRGYRCKCGGARRERQRLAVHTMQAWHQAWATEALRVLKPGGFLLAFGGTRTAHRLACAIEDAGFEIRDSVIWLYGSGFPKSLDVSKAIDRAAGAEREVVGKTGRCIGPSQAGENGIGTFKETNWQESDNLTAPATPEAQRWQGWGTALKPAHEPIVVARKPLIGTVSRNVAEFGTGALNIDGCRIGTDDRWEATGHESGPSVSLKGGVDGSLNVKVSETHPAGRWPANVALSHLPECERVGERRVKSGPSPYIQQTESGGYGGDLGNVKGKRSTHYADSDGLETVEAWRCQEGCPILELDQQSGERPASGTGSGGNGMGYGANAVEPREFPSYGDTGGAARFFYQAKASRAERNAGLEGFEERRKKVAVIQTPGLANDGDWEDGKQLSGAAANHHPTVKPVDLMRWLVRLVCPPGGRVLDCFAGSGTTGIACVLEDFDFIGIERESDYCRIAESRITYWASQPKQLGLLG